MKMKIYAIRDVKTKELIKVSYDQNTPFYLTECGVRKALAYRARRRSVDDYEVCSFEIDSNNLTRKMRLQIVINGEFEDERSLLNVDTDEVMMRGDYHHDKIDEAIDGFLAGLSYAGVEYEMLEDVTAYKDTELYEKCEFGY